MIAYFWASRALRAGVLGAAVAGLVSCAPAAQRSPEPPARDGAPDTGKRALLGDLRQLTFQGRRSGEGYFSADGERLVFQSEREPGNPFYQIYTLDLRTGETRRISPGQGKTTCGWIHPRGDRVLFASTHDDRASDEKQRAELEFRASGESRRYEWDYDPEYELYAAFRDGSVERLTRARGYDAEGSYSPDGQWIAFASNRHAYGGELEPEEAQRFADDPAVAMEIYLMRADGSGLRRLTKTPGYDGGPFFSPDGRRIVWRRFSVDGASSEIFTMALDGTDEKQLTKLGAMSWAPFFHPSGEYLIFATNLHGFGNFELYIVDREGTREPVRVTQSDGFDGLPAFHPGGEQLAFTSQRGASGRSQLFLASWDHADALRRIFGTAPARGEIPKERLRLRDGEIQPEDLRRHVLALTSDAMGGRATGSEGERRASLYVAGEFERLGLEPAGDDGSYFQTFEFPSAVSLGPDNRLSLVAESATSFELDSDWRPLSLSRVGRAGPAPVVFAGYGIVAPREGDHPGYDSYGDLEVRDRWVLVLRFFPEDLSPEQRHHLSRYAGLRYKAMLARQRGALGLIAVAGPASQVREPLLPLGTDASLAETSLFALSATPKLADRLLASAGLEVAELERELAGARALGGFEIPDARVEASVDLLRERARGRSVLARLRGRDSDAPALLIGAHFDHLGRGEFGSLAREDERGEIHRGADDNASGVAGLLEIARWLIRRDRAHARDVLLAAWSGEELGLIGSSHFARSLADPNPHSGEREIAAYLNLDMIGRFQGSLFLQGTGSSSVWERVIESGNAPLGLPIVAQADAYLPTDTTALYARGVPVLNAFTGPHEDYHTPRDTADKLDYPAAARISTLIATLVASLADAPETPDYVAFTVPRSLRGTIRVYLGTIPDYARSDVRGVVLSGVTQGGPAAKAGLKTGDVVVELAGLPVENIYDYTYAIEGLGVGESVPIAVLRDGERIELSITPASRQ